MVIIQIINSVIWKMGVNCYVAAADKDRREWKEVNEKDRYPIKENMDIIIIDTYSCSLTL